MRIPALLVTLSIALVAAPSAGAKQPPQLPQGPQVPQVPQTPVTPQQPADPQGVDPSSPNPLLGLRFYVDRVEQPAAKWYYRYKRQGKDGSAALMNKIASQPIFRWIGKSDHNAERNTRVFLQRAAERAPGTVAGITVLAHQGEKCHKSYTGGGARMDARYRRWFQRFVQGLGDHRVIVALEPDALGTLKCLHKSRRASRLRNLNYATELLARKPNVTTYIEAGASDWRPAREMARYLRQAGVHRVRGFSLNITHFDTNANNVRYGRQISRMLGGKHFVINTDENGVGRVWYRRWVSRARNLWRTVNVWCNPKRSALGTPPQAVNDPQLDGYLWMSRPGASAGACRGWNPRYAMRGGPKAGTFWAERALSLARQARW